MEITRCGTCSTLSLFFHIDIARSTPGEHLNVVGSHERLGAWNPEKGIRLTTSMRAYPVWRSKQIDLSCEPEESFLLLKYKYVLDRRELHQGFLWEENIPDREIRIPWAPGMDNGVWLIRDSAFNREGASTLTKLEPTSARSSLRFAAGGPYHMKCLGVFLAAYGTCFTLASPESEELGITSPLQLLQTKLDLQRVSRPNFLFLVLDQWRWDWDGRSDGVSLPTIDALGKSGVRFTRAYTPSPLCVPARSALAAVREYKDMWIKNNSNSYTGKPETTPTFMSVLRNVGYTTMLVGKDHLSDGADNLAGARQSVDMDALGVDWFIRAVDKYAFCYGYGEPVDAYSTYLKELDLLQKQCEAYGIFSLGESCRKTQVCDSTSIIECGFRCPEVNSVDHNHSVDSWVRRSAEELLRRHREKFGLEKPTLERYEMRRNTVIVVTGDHGDHLGDLGHFSKTSPWEPSVHVPLLVAGPSLPQGHVVDHPVSLIDVPMTFLDLAKAKALDTMQGYSLKPALMGSATARPAVMFGLNYLEEFAYDVDGAIVSLGRKQFEASAAMFGRDFLKLICCPSGCRKQGGCWVLMMATWGLVGLPVESAVTCQKLLRSPQHSEGLMSTPEETPELEEPTSTPLFDEKYALTGRRPFAKGGFSSVWRCRRRDSTNSEFAAKRIDLAGCAWRRIVEPRVVTIAMVWDVAQ
eukprot:s315_g23.t1